MGPLPKPVSRRVLPSSSASIGQLDLALHSGDLVGPHREARRDLVLDEILAREDVPHLSREDLAALVVGVTLDHAGELDLQSPRQVEVVLLLHDVRDAALARLRVDADDRLIGATHVPGVDRQVRNAPRVQIDRRARLGRVPGERVKALLDGVLV